MWKRIEAVITCLARNYVAVLESDSRKNLMLQWLGGAIKKKIFCSFLHQFSLFSEVFFEG